MPPNARFGFVLSFGLALSLGACGCTQRAPSRASAQSTSRAPPSTAEDSKTRASMPSAPSASELSRRAIDAVAARGIGFRLSPLLPAAWPPHAELECLAYQVEPLPTGVESFTVKGPAHRVTVRLPSGTAEVSPVSDGKPLGTDRETGACGQPAEQALVDVVAGTRSAESARAELSSYVAWAARQGAIGDDVRRRYAAFFAWLAAMP